MKTDAGSRTRIVISRSFSHACLVRHGVANVVQLPLLEQVSEIGFDGDADVAIVGEPARVLLGESTGRVHIVDPTSPDAPVKLAELVVEPDLRFLAATRNYVVVGTPSGPAIVAPNGSRPAVHRIPLRGALGAIGPAAAPDNFVASVAGAFEEWNAELRAPLRRFRLERPVTAKFLGANRRHIWLVADGAASDVVIVPLASSRPTRLALPEPALRVTADADGEHLAIVGAESRGVFVASLADRTVRMVHPGPVDDAAWYGDSAIVCAGDSALEMIKFSPKPDAEPAEEHEASPAALSASERFSQWKRRVAQGIVEDLHGDFGTATGPVQAPWQDEPVVALHEWRDAIATWTRRSLAGNRGEPPLLAAGPLQDLTVRFDLSPDDALIVWLAYGARLCGLDGLAPIDIAAIARRRWHDALGHTRLHELGILRRRKHRVDLTREVADALDQLPPHLGTAVDSPIAGTGTVGVVARSSDLPAIGAWVAPRLGALLVPNDLGLRSPRRFLVEARARGLRPLVPAEKLDRAPHLDRAIVVVEDHDAAARLALEIALTYGEPTPTAS